MDAQRRQQLVERYRMAVRAVLVAVDHVSEADLDVRPDAKSWPARQVVHHLADASMHQGISLRRMLAENTPVLVPFDESHFAERLHYNRPVEASLDAFRANSFANIELLESLTEEQWRRAGNQQKPWPLTIEGWLEEEVLHIHNRLMQIVNAPAGGRVIADPDEGLKLSR
ncbi:MAG TPA: DinB family protein [Dehalococcoidia bacterium]|nr:DinB family protein [Dehalococcoidia bacterium]